MTDESLLQALGLASRHLRHYSPITALDLAGSAISDAGLAHLKGLTNLELLDLRSTRLTEAGLTYLTGLFKLKQLDQRGTPVTSAGLKGLRQALPKCVIRHGDDPTPGDAGK